eukprot:6872715-Pyramimonas_sp.AAC.1
MLYWRRPPSRDAGVPGVGGGGDGAGGGSGGAGGAHHLPRLCPIPPRAPALELPPRLRRPLRGHRAPRGCVTHASHMRHIYVFQASCRPPPDPP